MWVMCEVLISLKTLILASAVPGPKRTWACCQCGANIGAISVNFGPNTKTAEIPFWGPKEHEDVVNLKSQKLHVLDILG